MPMTTTYKPYPAYKDSGVEWANHIPHHWQHAKLRWLALLYAGGTPSKNILEYWEKGTIPWLNSGTVNQIKIRQPSTYITEVALRNSSAKWIPKGAMTMALAGQGKTKGKVALLDIDATCNQSMAAIVPHHLENSSFLFWWLTSNYQNIRNLAGGDLRDGLNLELLGSINCLIPEKKEQTQIANFLDHETARIDTLIAKQKKLIALLKEKRQAVISHAVTKGLNPDVEMKDSGVEWLGEVPAHWKITSLKYFANVVDCKHITATFFDEGIPLASISEVKEKFVNLSSAKHTNEAFYLELISGGRKPQKGDIIYSRNATVGEAAIVPEDSPKFAMGQDVCLIRAKITLNSEFLLYILKSGLIHNQLNVAMVGSTFKRINVDNIRNFLITIPPQNEQLNIKSYLNHNLTIYDALILKAESAINLMKERRTALISAAVTGKIDLRDWQAPQEQSAKVLVGQEA